MTHTELLTDRAVLAREPVTTHAMIHNLSGAESWDGTYPGNAVARIEERLAALAVQHAERVGGRASDEPVRRWAWTRVLTEDEAAAYQERDERAERDAAPCPRARAVAAIHAFADWLAANPDTPVPHYVTAFHRTSRVEEVDEDVRVGAVMTWSRAVGAELSEDPYEVVGRLQVGSRDVHGINFTYRWSAALDDRRPRRFVR